ncbi:MAG: hypothetical protein ABL888_07790, partial [Pirellulaceae bacterium]
MSISCPKCFSKLQVPASAKGKRAKCPKCEGIVEIPVQTEQVAIAANDPFGNPDRGAIQQHVAEMAAAGIKQPDP